MTEPIDAATLPLGPPCDSRDGARLDVAERYFVVFRTCSVWLAVPALTVDHILDFEGCRSLPTAPAHIRGLMGVRGRAIPVVDLAVWLGLPSGNQGAGAASEKRHERVLVVSSKELSAALHAEHVIGALAAPEPDLSAPQATATQRLRQYAEAEFRFKGHCVTVLMIQDVLEHVRVR